LTVAALTTFAPSCCRSSVGYNDNELCLGAPALNPGWAEKYNQTAWDGLDNSDAEDEAEPRRARPNDI
jgi:hypothetical protein